jgi:hypothetical protein
VQADQPAQYHQASSYYTDDSFLAAYILTEHDDSLSFDLTVHPGNSCQAELAGRTARSVMEWRAAMPTWIKRGKMRKRIREEKNNSRE